MAYYTPLHGIRKDFHATCKTFLKVLLLSSLLVCLSPSSTSLLPSHIVTVSCPNRKRGYLIH